MKANKLLPAEVIEYINTLAPASQNNSRAIVRENCRRIIEESVDINEAYRTINQKYKLNIPVDNSMYDNPPF